MVRVDREPCDEVEERVRWRLEVPGSGRRSWKDLVSANVTVWGHVDVVVVDDEDDDET